MLTLRRLAAQTVDSAMCASMFAIQRRHCLHANSRRELEEYAAACAPLTRDEFFGGSALPPPSCSPDAEVITWQSPISSGYPQNDRPSAMLFRSSQGWEAPTVIFLHALMSASDIGYRRWAADFNARGWNACFLHLPYHYSRKPQGYWNGELAITADLIRTGQGLRQGVAEVRQLMTLLRSWGCREFGLWASSYGGWIGALLASVERDFRWLALMEPIVDVEHAIWVSPAGAALRRELRARGIDHALVEQHFHLISPLHAQPLCGGGRTILIAGEWDRIALASDIRRLHTTWADSTYFSVQQGHFGYTMMRSLWQHLLRGSLLEPHPLARPSLEPLASAF